MMMMMMIMITDGRNNKNRVSFSYLGSYTVNLKHYRVKENIFALIMYKWNFFFFFGVQLNLINGPSSLCSSTTINYRDNRGTISGDNRVLQFCWRIRRDPMQVDKSVKVFRSRPLR